MKLEPANIVCPVCGSGDYMRHLIGKNVGHLDMKCINCNSYFNFDELYKRRIGEVLEPKPITNYDRLRAMTDEEPAEYLANICYDFWAMLDDDPKKVWLEWLRQEASDGNSR